MSSIMKNLLGSLLFWYFIISSSSFKEHKVHNIVLYPDQHSWCKVTPIKQIVNDPNCGSKTYENNVCVGQCFSFSVPKTVPEIPNDDKLHYCDSCRPSNTTWITVSLECPASSEWPLEEVKKRIEIIHDCSCQSCIPFNAELTQDDEVNEMDMDYYSSVKPDEKHLSMDNRAKLKTLKEEEIKNDVIPEEDIP